ncbi:MAG: hypothetical protein ACXWVT_06040 [Burkholderiaceae bacterium]
MLEIVVTVYLFCAWQFLALVAIDRALGFDRPGLDGDQHADCKSPDDGRAVSLGARLRDRIGLADASP